jgi:hypothetical protein
MWELRRSARVSEPRRSGALQAAEFCSDVCGCSVAYGEYVTRGRLVVWAARLSAAICLLVLMIGLAHAGTAQAAGQTEAEAGQKIEFFSALPSTTQAGGHPDVEIDFGVPNRIRLADPNPCDCEDAKNSTVEFPAGFIGNPHAAPQCSMAEFATDSCPIDSQVGIVHVGVSDRVGGDIPFDSAVYNLVPPPNVSGLSGFKIFSFDTPQFLELSARTGSDYGLNATALALYHGEFPLHTYQEDLWGVPADPSHNLLRVNKSETQGGETAYLGELCDASGAISTTDPSTIVKPCFTNFKNFAPISSNSPPIPFLQNPTSCESSLRSNLNVLFYSGVISEESAPWPQMTGCDQLSFNPSLYAQPTTTATDTPSGINVDLSIPQQLSPSIPSPTELRATTVTLPPGFSINPGAADGKTACSDAEARFGSEEEGQCSEYSKVGSLTIESSALPGPLPGSVYLGQPEPGNRYRIFLIASGFAFNVKLAGTVSADPVTGQLSISFQNLPQSPLTAFNMHFFGSERGLLATPTECGTYPVTTTFMPWDETIGTQTSSQFFTLDSGPGGSPCPGAQRPFHPTFKAASTLNNAGSHAPLSIEVTRADGDQNLTGLTVSTPPGLLATLKGIPYCSDSALSAAARDYSGLEEGSNPSCPAASQIGTSTAGAGAGTHPVYLPGKVYLAGPYKGAPLSLAVITPAVSGPYDLGNVVVRAALEVNPETAQITAVSDPLPQILEGIPLRLREVRIELNRPNFALNPTNCNPFSVDATILASEGAQSGQSVQFQVANCTALPFAPKLALKLQGSPKRSGTPALTATLTTKSGEANIAKAQVALPHSEFLDNAHIGAVCTKPQLAAEKCPPASVYGHAKAETPLLEKPLEGPVYLGSGYGTKLPELVADLNGQIHILLRGKIDTDQEGGIRNSFEVVPDAPVSKFTLSLAGGKKGLLENSEDICRKPQQATVKLTGQNGRVENSSPLIANSCGAKAKTKRKADEQHRARGAGR